LIRLSLGVLSLPEVACPNYSGNPAFRMASAYFAISSAQSGLLRLGSGAAWVVIDAPLPEVPNEL